MDIQTGHQGDGGPTRVAWSTGRLSVPTATLLDRWRDRLRLDKPLPGHSRVGPELRAIGIDDRPKASFSAAVCAAVADMLDTAPPDPIDVAREHERARRDGDSCQPATFWMPAALHERGLELRAQARFAVIRALAELDVTAAELHPDSARDRVRWARAERIQRGYPAGALIVPGGAVGRLAIARWAQLPVDQVCLRAVAWAGTNVSQAHRAHRDLRRLSPEPPGAA